VELNQNELLKKELSNVTPASLNLYVTNLDPLKAVASKKTTPKSCFKSTVKPVYNGHPWDLKKVAV
jgi:hypothetical protein